MDNINENRNEDNLIADGIIKVSFGAYLFFFSKPTTNRAV